MNQVNKIAVLADKIRKHEWDFIKSNFESYIPILNKVIYDDKNILHLLCDSYYDYEVIKLCLNHGANANALTKRLKFTPLMYITQNFFMNNIIDVVKLLLDYGANPKYIVSGYTPLMNVSSLCKHGKHNDIIGIVELLLKHGADPNIQDGSGQTAIKYFIEYSNDWPDVLKLFIKYGINLNNRNTINGYTVFHTIIILVNPPTKSLCDMVKLMLDNGADPNIATSDGTTPLMSASVGKDLDIIKLLIKYGAKINVQDDAGQSALTYSIIGSSLNVIKLLLDNGADVTVKTKNNSNIISMTRNPEIIKLIMNHSINQYYGYRDFLPTTLLTPYYRHQIEIETIKKVTLQLLKQNYQEWIGHPDTNLTHFLFYKTYDPNHKLNEFFGIYSEEHLKTRKAEFESTLTKGNTQLPKKYDN